MRRGSTAAVISGGLPCVEQWPFTLPASLSCSEGGDWGWERSGKRYKNTRSNPRESPWKCGKFAFAPFFPCNSWPLLGIGQAKQGHSEGSEKGSKQRSELLTLPQARMGTIWEPQHQLHATKRIAATPWTSYGDVRNGARGAASPAGYLWGPVHCLDILTSLEVTGRSKIAEILHSKNSYVCTTLTKTWVSLTERRNWETHLLGLLKAPVEMPNNQRNHKGVLEL